MASVVLDTAKFKTAFPEFATVPDARLTVLFGLSGALVDNTGTSPITDLDQRESILFYVLAHMLTLYGSGVAGAVGGAPNGVVGRLSSATEGTVSSSFEFNVPQSAGAAWWNQTQYGALYWMLTAQYRTFRYVALGQSGQGRAIDYIGRRVAPFGGLLDGNSGTPDGI